MGRRSAYTQGANGKQNERYYLIIEAHADAKFRDF